MSHRIQSGRSLSFPRIYIASWTYFPGLAKSALEVQTLLSPWTFFCMHDTINRKIIEWTRLILHHEDDKDTGLRL